MKRLLAAAWAMAIPVSLSAQGSAPDVSKTRLRNPAALNDRAPDVFKARFDASKGPFVIEVHRDWAPIGADRFFNLVKNGYYDDTRFFRVIDGLMAQVGINGTPSVQAGWRAATIKDDPVKQSNKRGFVSFSNAGPDSRSTQFFISLVDNARYDRMGFAPIGEVVSGMENVDRLYSGYGDGAPNGNGPIQQRIQTEGNAYLVKEFPKLDFVKKAIIDK
jgi:peptidyl-prolyl cis-trans isomerase A (cyclophilin A)